MQFPPLRQGVILAQLGDNLASALPEGERQADYDRIAWLYDAIIGNGLYNRLVWGVRRSDYHAAALRAVGEATAESEWILDCGCGSLVFTATAYRQVAPPGLVLLDRSLAMLRRAHHLFPAPLALQGDALNLPFEDATFDHTMTWGLAHLFGAKSKLIAELARVTRSGGRLALSAIVLSNRRLGNAMLHGLVRRGEAAAAEPASAYLAAVEPWFDVVEHKQIGNMLFVSAFRRDFAGLDSHRSVIYR